MQIDDHQNDPWMLANDREERLVNIKFFKCVIIQYNKQKSFQDLYINHDSSMQNDNDAMCNGDLKTQKNEQTLFC